MLPTRPATTAHLTLQAVLDRLATRPEVEGLLTIGSTSGGAVTPVSDYDLVVVVNALPVALNVALTTIDGRLTDILFVAAAELDGGAGQWGAAQLGRWLRAGQVVFDRAGRLGAAQAAARAAAEPAPTDQDRYAAWFSLNYNVQQTRRLLASADPAYQLAVDLRLLFSLHDVWRAYFTARGLGVAGEKEQARYLLAHDPAFLHAFQDCLAEAERGAKFQQYAQLAAEALAPLGRLWADGTTSVMPDPAAPWQADTPAQALAFWQRLVGGDAEVGSER